MEISEPALISQQTFAVFVIGCCGFVVSKTQIAVARDMFSTLENTFGSVYRSGNILDARSVSSNFIAFTFLSFYEGYSLASLI